MKPTKFNKESLRGEGGKILPPLPPSLPPSLPPLSSPPSQETTHGSRMLALGLALCEAAQIRKVTCGTWSHMFGVTSGTWSHMFRATGGTWSHMFGGTSGTWSHMLGVTSGTWSHMFTPHVRTSASIFPRDTTKEHDESDVNRRSYRMARGMTHGPR
jgi:hypothetical protein